MDIGDKNKKDRKILWSSNSNRQNFLGKTIERYFSFVLYEDETFTINIINLSENNHHHTDILTIFQISIQKYRCKKLDCIFFFVFKLEIHRFPDSSPSRRLFLFHGSARWWELFQETCVEFVSVQDQLIATSALERNLSGRVNDVWREKWEDQSFLFVKPWK